MFPFRLQTRACFQCFWKKRKRQKCCLITKHILISCWNIKTYWLPTKREIKIYLKTGSLIDFLFFFPLWLLFLYKETACGSCWGGKGLLRGRLRSNGRGAFLWGGRVKGQHAPRPGFFTSLFPAHWVTPASSLQGTPTTARLHNWPKLSFWQFDLVTRSTLLVCCFSARIGRVQGSLETSQAPLLQLAAVRQSFPRGNWSCYHATWSQRAPLTKTVILPGRTQQFVLYRCLHALSFKHYQVSLINQN